MNYRHGLESGVIINSQDIQIMELTAIESPDVLPEDAYIVVSYANPILCIPLSYTTRLHADLWGIPFLDFAPHGLPTGPDLAYHVQLKSRSDACFKATLHYRLVETTVDPLRDRYESFMYMYNESTEFTIDRCDFSGLCLPQNMDPQLKVKYMRKETCVFDYNYMQLLIYGKRHNGYVKLQCEPSKKTQFQQRIEFSHPVPGYIILYQVLWTNALKTTIKIAQQTYISGNSRSLDQVNQYQ